MKRSIGIAGGVAVLVLLLTGAGFMAGRLLNSRPSEAETVVAEGPDGTKMVMAEKMDIEYAKEMPDASPNIGGLFVRREGSSLYIGTGDVSATLVDGDRGDASRWDVRYDGPVVEVVTTQDALIYHDDTLRQIEGGPPSGPIQQVLTLSTLDAIGKDSIVSAWVERRGNRMVAKVIVFSSIV
jgi:hypothetical protein